MFYRLPIGQSETAVTPLQMAVVANTIANEGIRYQPHLVDSLWDYNQTELLQDIEPVIAETIPIQNDSVYSLIEQGMIAASVTNMPEQYSLANLGYDVAIKTGYPTGRRRQSTGLFLHRLCTGRQSQNCFCLCCRSAEYSKYMIRDVLKAYERLETRQAESMEKDTTKNG